MMRVIPSSRQKAATMLRWSRLRIVIAVMMIYLQKRVIDQNSRAPTSTEKARIRCGMTDRTGSSSSSVQS